MSDLVIWEAPALTPWDAPATLFGGISSHIKQTWQTVQQSVRELSVPVVKEKAAHFADWLSLTAFNQNMNAEGNFYGVVDILFSKPLDFSSFHSILDSSFTLIDDALVYGIPRIVPPVTQGLQRYVYTIPSVAQGVDIARQAKTAIKDMAIEASTIITAAIRDELNTPLSPRIGAALAIGLIMAHAFHPQTPEPAVQKFVPPSDASKAAPQIPGPAPRFG